MHYRLLLVLFFISAALSAQQKKEAPKPVFREISNKDIVQNVFPDATKVEKENQFWFRILDANNKVLGYAMSSSPFCQDIKGYHNTTPVLIVTDSNLVIKKIAMLSNWESLGYVRKLEKKGFFDLWNDKTIKDARSIQADGYTGATMTARAVSKNVDFLLDNGLKNLPKKNKNKAQAL